MRLVQLYFIFGLLLLTNINCDKKDNTSSVKETRTFYMGATPWPADFTSNDVDSAYQFINNHCDIVSHHFDEGIPYEEAFHNNPMPAGLLQDVTTRKNKTANGKKIFLSVSALSLDRISRAGYYNNTPASDSIKNYWQQLNFDDTRVVTAYVNYISWLIEQLQPLYVNFGVESNAASWNAGRFLLYKKFIGQVYGQLKTKYSNTPFLISFIVDESTDGFSYASQLVDYTDFIGLSAYPYISSVASANGNTNPQNLPENYFEKFTNLAPQKPVAITETGYIAGDLTIAAYNLNKQGTVNWQRDYLEKMLTFCDSKKAKMIIWFCSKDYDAGNVRLKSLGLYQDIFAFWQDTGFKDEHGNERPAYNSWNLWMGRIKID
jgi:hypothetical protein